MNALEERFATDVLALLVLAKEISWWEFEPLRLRLGGSAFYRPDFVAVDAKGQVVCYEVKGHWREAARARIKIAAERFPWMRFHAVKHDRRGGWIYETFEPGP
jgi:hypothetical protein